MVRVVQKVEESPIGETDFEALQPKDILYATSINLKLEYGFYLLGKRFRALVTKQKISCLDIRALGGSDMPDTSLQAQYLMFTRGETLYSLRCKRRKVYLAADWETWICLRELPLWAYAENHQKTLRFLTPGSRLLVNSSKPENCTQAKTIHRGYKATSGEWVALTPCLQILKSPLEMVLEKLDDNV